MMWSSVRKLIVRIGFGVAGIALLSTTTNAHEFGHASIGHGDGVVAFAVVVGLPTLAGLVGGIVAIRYRRFYRSETTEQGTSTAVGLLLVGLGVAILLPVMIEHLWLSVAGGTIGALITSWIPTDGRTSGPTSGFHATLTLGAISVHRVLEGVVLGTLYSTGAALGMLGAVLLAGHTLVEVAAVGGLYVTDSRRTRAVSAIVLVQAGYVVGAAAGIVLVGSVSGSVRLLALATVGGVLLVVGAGETKHSHLRGNGVTADDI